MKKKALLCLLVLILFCTTTFVAGKKETSRAVSDRTAAQVDLDYLYSKDNRSTLDQNLNKIIEKMKKDGINKVYLQSFCDKKGDGNIKSVYFKTKYAPLEADIFQQAVSKFKKEKISVYAWIPTLSCQWLATKNNLAVSTESRNSFWYNRVSPFSREVKENLIKVYSDLALHNSIDGILFQDDLYLSDFEDFSVHASKEFKKEFGMELNTNIKKNKNLYPQWIDFKTDALINLTNSISDEMKKHLPKLKVERNVYSTIINDPNSKEWFAQDFKKCIKNYDKTVVMAYPYLEENCPDESQWLGQLLAKSKALSAKEQDKVVMKLQTFNWKTNKKVPVRDLTNWTELCRKNGFHNIAYYPYSL